LKGAEKMVILDISADIANCDIYPGDPPVKIETERSMGEGAECNLSAIYTGLHNGTHADAPLHFVEDGMTIDEMPLEKFIGECTVLDVPEGPITGDYVERKFPRNKERILIKSGGKAYFHETAATELAYMKIKLIGTDALSVGTAGAQSGTHRAFLREDIAILEGLNLGEVQPGEYFLMAQPLKIGGAEAAPVRAVLVADYIFWSKGR